MNKLKLYKSKLITLIALLFLSIYANSQSHSLVINGAVIYMDGGTATRPLYIAIDQPNSNGIIRQSSGHIHSENQYNYILWNSGNETGEYIIPFGVGQNTDNFIPFTFQKTSNGNTNIQMSTWHTDILNYPRPQLTNVDAVTHMTENTDSLNYAIDRFWDIRATNTTANLIFSYLGAENTTYYPQGLVCAQHWNGTSWDESILPGTPGVTTGIGTAGTFQNQTDFSPWVLVIMPDCLLDEISYSQEIYCNEDDNTYAPSHTETNVSGSFHAEPAGLNIDENSGIINPSLSLPGEYTVVFSVNANDTCPAYQTTTTLSIEATPEITITNSDACFGETITITTNVEPQNTYNYQWNVPTEATNPGNTNNFTTNTEGEYTVSVTSVNNCSSEQSIIIEYPDEIELDFTKNDVNCFEGSDGSINLTVAGGIPNYSFQWNDGSTSQNRTGLSSDTYSVTVTDNIGCTKSIDITIDQPDVFEINATITNIDCFGNNNGQIALSIENQSITDYSFAWSNQQTTSTISQLIAGTYSVTATDNNGCTKSETYTITQAEQIEIDSEIIHPSCFGDDDGEINVTVSGGTPTYTYQWNIHPSPPTTTSNLTGLESGEYSVIVTDANSCTVIETFTLNEPDEIVIDVQTLPASCNEDNGEATITVQGGTPEYTYNWASSANNATTASVEGLSSGEHSVTVTDQNNCSTNISIEIESIDPPEINIVEVINETCSEGNAAIVIEVISGTPEYQYSWSANPENNTPSIDSLSGGMHSVTVTDQSGCEVVEEILISNHLPPTATITALNPAHCDQADASVSFVIEGIGDENDFTANWNTTPPRYGTTEENLLAGTYNITISDGVCETDFEIIIPNLAGPTAIADASPNPTTINNSNVRFFDHSIGDPTHWYWSFGDGNASNEQNPSNLYSSDGEFEAILTVIDEYGCIDSDTITIIVKPTIVIWIPDAFTPNGDGLNETFGPSGVGIGDENYKMYIYNRWGELIFLSEKFDDRWDGKINGIEVPSNVFVYRILFTDSFGYEYERVGRVTLLR
ncbi:MAG: T9SS type B sorting domain-containing protein [Bacteroidales bacterium]|jgi:gliding motility-associated-like protein|nr:T9SS type B sorting domain-containing protein [Bacteroidales bacterium]